MWKSIESGIQTKSGVLNKPLFRARISVRGKSVSGKVRKTIEAARNDKMNLKKSRVPRVVKNRYTKERKVTTLNSYFPDFLKSSTSSGYISSLRSKVLPRLGNVPLSSLQFKDFDAIASNCSKWGEVNTLHYALKKLNIHIKRKFGDQSWDWKDYDDFFNDIKRTMDKSSVETKYLLNPQISAVLQELALIQKGKFGTYTVRDVSKAEAFHDFFMLSILLGGRVNEILSLKISDYKNGRISILEQITPTGKRKAPKRFQRREFEVFENAKPILDALVEKANQRGTEYLITYKGSNGLSGLP